MIDDSYISNEEVDHVDYKWSQILGFKFILLFFLILLVGFFVTFPIKEQVESTLRATLANNSSCPIHFNQSHYSFFMPGVELTEVSIPARCSQGTLQDLRLPKVKMSLAGLSFSPLGLAFSSVINLPNNQVDAKIVLGLGTLAVKMDEVSLALPELMKLLKDSYKVEGDAVINLRLVMKDQVISEGEARIQSQNLVMPAQSIKGFDVPTLDLNNVDIIVQIPEGQNLYQLNTINIGTVDSALRINGNGVMSNIDNGLSESNLNIELEISPSQKLIDNFMILESLLQAYNFKDGFYRLKVEGRASAPQIKSF